MRLGLAMTMPIEIQTERLRLRPVQAQDEAAVVAALDDFAVAKWLAVVPFPYTVADFQVFLTGIAVPGDVWLIEDAQGFAGIISLQPELGYWLGARAQGLGYMTEAARAILATAFAGDAALTVLSGYFVGNGPSSNVLTKLGFVETGRDTRANRAQAAMLPHVALQLSRHDFVAALPVAARSARLAYRCIQPVDFAALHAIGSDWSVVRQLGSWPWPPEPDFTTIHAKPYGGIGFAWGMFLDGAMIGTVAVTDAIMGYSLLPAHWRQGYGEEAARTAIAHAFGATDLARIAASVWYDNAASLGLLIKLGFAETGRTVEMSKARKVEVELVHLVLDRADWPPHHPAA